MMRLLIRADASASIGSGHVMRCLALAQHWQARGGSVTFLSHCESDAVCQHIKSSGCSFVMLEQPHPDPLDLSTTLSTIKQLANLTSADSWLVLDGYHFDPEYQRMIRSAGHKLIVIDDTAHLANYHADVLLNQNIYADRLDYNCDADTTLLLGTRYALLRQEFLGWREWQRKTPEIARKVLVTMGGGDPDNVTLRVIRALCQVNIEGLEVLVVVGENNPHFDVLKDAISAAAVKEHGPHPSIQMVRNASNMPELMAWADMAVSAGGSTCWEATFLGLPSCIIVLAKNQLQVAKILGERGIAVNVGWFASINEAELIRTITNMIQDGKRRHEMCLKGKSLVDGKGCDRTVKAILKQ